MTLAGKSAPLDFDEFDAVSHADWQAAAEALLPEGASLDSLTRQTYEGFSLQPLYGPEHLAGGTGDRRTLRGYAPGAQGNRPWWIVQAGALPEPAALNSALRDDLRQGGTAVQLFPDAAALRCLDSGPSAPGVDGGCSLRRAGDFSVALAGLALHETPLLLQCGARSAPLPAALMAGLRSNGADTRGLRGSVGADPMAWLAATGSLPAAPDALYDEQAEWLRWCVEHAPKLDGVFLDGAVWHDAGAHAAQELACSLANAAATLRAMLSRDLALHEVAPRFALSLSTGGDFLMDLAKLRAMRLLWGQMIEALGAAATSAPLTIHARSGRRNRSALDPWNNMLRNTLEALTAAIGACDSLLIEPFDSALRAPDEFSRRHARNQQLILQHEVGLASLQDPAGGSWTLEVMTDWLAREAWSGFQELERRGGLLAALRAGSVQRDIAAVAQMRALRNASRRDVLVGSNLYADDEEFMAGHDASFAHKTDLSRQRTQSGENDRVASPASDGARLDLASLVEAAADGASIAQLTGAQDHGPVQGLAVTPLDAQRLSAPWEALRANASAHRRQGGTTARVFLALCGEAAALHARASFVSDFFRVGGFECIDGEVWSGPEEAVSAALDSGAPVVVLCARDGDYLTIAPGFCAAIQQRNPKVQVFVAGRPDPAQARDLEAAGVAGFVHLGADCLAINRALQRYIGIAP